MGGWQGHTNLWESKVSQTYHSKVYYKNILEKIKFIKQLSSNKFYKTKVLIVLVEKLTKLLKVNIYIVTICILPNTMAANMLNLEFHKLYTLMQRNYLNIYCMYLKFRLMYSKRNFFCLKLQQNTGEISFEITTFWRTYTWRHMKDLPIFIFYLNFKYIILISFILF